MDADGSNQKQLTGRSGVEGSASNISRGSPSVSRDGRYIVFGANSTGSFDIWRMDSNGDNLKQLTADGAAFSPVCSPDGQWVVYTSNSAGKDSLLKVGMNGGEPLQLTDKPSPYPAISPDGKLIACFYGDERSNSPWKIALIPFEGGGQPTKLLDVQPTVTLDTPIKGTPDGRAVV